MVDDGVECDAAGNVAVLYDAVSAIILRYISRDAANFVIAGDTGIGEGEVLDGAAGD